MCDCISRTSTFMGKGSKNLDPLVLVDEQKTDISTSKMTKQQLTWKDIEQHGTKTSRWIVIDKRVYDITRWTKHPGGQVVLKHYAGQDATV